MTKQHNRKFSVHASLLARTAAIALMAAGLSAPAMADDGKRKIDFDIKSQSLESALQSFAVAANLQILFPTEIVDGKRSPALKGEMSDTEALEEILEGSGLVYERTASGVVLVRGKQDGAALQTPIRYAQVQDAERVVSDAAPARVPDETPRRRDERDGERKLDTVTVTGSLIRGLAPESSPLQIFDREDILNSGVTTTEQFIRTLPQNFGGGSSEFVAVGIPSDANASSNLGFGTSANLRGLGSGSTLVLLNGNRLATSSNLGEFVDLSLIPVSALKRVDILTDGASSMYGGDAVAGVINFILRDDFEGSETSIRYGTVTNGHMEEYRASQTVGASWQNGNILGIYEFHHRDNLTLDDRPRIAAPTGPNGLPSEGMHLHDLLPEQQRHSALISLNQDITPSLSVAATGLYSKRSVDRSVVQYSNSVTTVGYDSNNESLTLNAGVQYEFWQNWSLNVNGNYSEQNSHGKLQSIVASPFEIDSKLWSVDALINGVLFDVPAGTVSAAVGAHARNEDFTYTIRQSVSRDAIRDVWAVFGELNLPVVGSSNTVPGIERFELNLSGRHDDYSDFGSSSNVKIGVLWAPFVALKLRGSYSESFAPPPLGRVGDLGRGGTVSPMTYITNLLGIAGQYPQLEGYNHLSTFGTSANLLPSTSEALTLGFDYELARGQRDWTISGSYYDIQFTDRLDRMPMPRGLDVTYAPFLAFDDPSLFPPGIVIFNPSAQQVSEILATFANPPQIRPGASLENIGVINNAALIRNVSSVETSGFDLRIQHKQDTDFGLVSAGLNASYIIAFDQQAADTSPKVETLNTLYYPVDFKLRGNLGFSSDGFSGSLFVNYTDGYRTDQTATSVPIGSWTTADLMLSYKFDGEKWDALRNAAISLSITNLLDQDPPATPTLSTIRIAGFDPANASPLGRLVAVEIRKSF